VSGSAKPRVVLVAQDTQPTLHTVQLCKLCVSTYGRVLGAGGVLILRSWLYVLFSH
jgi:hypothetical protein